MSQYISFFVIGVLSIYISIHDVKYHRVENWTHPTIMFLSLFLCNATLADRFAGLLLCFLPVFVANLVSKNRIGMGDAKLLGAFGFMLGSINGYICMLLAFATSVAFSFSYQKIKHEKKAHPLAPFICGSSVFVLLMEVIC